MSLKKLYLEPSDPDALRRWMPSLIASVAFLMAGMICTYVISRDSSVINHRLSHVREAIAKLQSESPERTR